MAQPSTNKLDDRMADVGVDVDASATGAPELDVESDAPAEVLPRLAAMSGENKNQGSAASGSSRDAQDPRVPATECTLSRDDLVGDGLKLSDFCFMCKDYGKKEVRVAAHSTTKGGGSGDTDTLLRMLQLEIQKERAEKEKEIYRRQLAESKSSGAGLSPTMSELMKTVEEKLVDAWWEPRTAVLKFPIVTQESAKPPVYKIGPVKKQNSSVPQTFDGVLEDVTEAAFHPLFSRVFKAAAEHHHIFWFDGHTTFWLLGANQRGRGLAPDAVASNVRVVGAPIARHVMALHDNKQRRAPSSHPAAFSGFTNDDKGGLVRDLSRVLEHQPERDTIAGSLFDGKFAQCFQYSERRGRTLLCGPVLDCSNKEDAQLFVAYLMSRDALKWDVPAVLPICGDLLGVGVSGMVYRHAAKPDCVVKMPRKGQEQRVAEERKLLTNASVVSNHFIRLHDDDDEKNSYLLLTPVCEPVPGPYFMLLPSYFLPLWNGPSSPLQQMHTNGYVHMDIRPENVMHGPNGVVLVDGGAVRRTDVAALFSHGTLFFASDHVLSAVNTRAAFKASGLDDLESVVRCMFVMTTMPADEYQKQLVTADRSVERIMEFWRNIRSRHSLWAPIFRAAQQGADALSMAVQQRFS